MPVGEFLNLSSQRRGPFLRTNVLVQAEEVIRIVMRLNSYQTLPAFLVRFRNPVVLVATHEVDVNAWSHSGAESSEQVSNPCDVGRVLSGVRPIAKHVHNEWRTAVTECCLGCANSGRSSTQIGKLNLSHRRGNASQRLHHVVNAAIVESLEVTGLGVIPPAMGKLGVGHCLQSEKR